MRSRLAGRAGIIVSFVAVVLATTIGLWTIQHTNTLILKNRAERLSQLHDQDVKICQRTHRLDVAITVQNRVLHDAEERAIEETQGIRIPGVTPEQITQAIKNAERLVKQLEHVKQLAAKADCMGVPKLTLSP